MEASDPRRTDHTLAGIVPGRLAAPYDRDHLPDPVVNDDHQRVVEEALAWQQIASSASFWEMGATHRGAEQDRAYALAGQMASAGEQLGLASAAGNEVAIWREYREGQPPDVGDELCMRGMAEAQCLFAMSTGHAFANVGLKALALDAGLKAKLIESLGRRSAAFQPLSADRRDWVSMDRKVCGALKAVAESTGDPDVVRLIDPVVEFGLGAAWSELDERRGEDFHRWRMQTHGVAGVPRMTPWSSDGKTRTLKIGNPAYAEAEGLAEEVAQIGSTAMLELAKKMELFRQRFPTLSVRLGGPRFRSD